MSVRVVARIRPLLPKELDKDTIVTADSTEEGKPATLVKIPNPKNESEEFSFAFNSVYDQAATQEALFASEVSPHLKSLFQGLDVTIFAYGVTGTGKTHTMRGGLKLADRGVIPRLLSGIYRRGKKTAKDTDGQTTVDVALSYYEIYNDKVFDLMEPPEKRLPAGLPLREKDGKTIVVGLSERPCQDLKDFEKLYIEANNNRVTASTKLNAHSSRSHAILRVKVTQTTGDVVRESTASAIDLAGSEDNRRTDNGKERLVESAAINKSLFVLSQCIDAISRGDKRIPYRESKMTRILSLGQNNGITIMILNLAPLRSYHLDTLSSLNVSSRAKRIEVREIENEVVFKQVPRTNSNNGAGTMHQALRPLANAHNVHSGVMASKEKAADATRPVKAFSVYTDKSKPTAMARPTAVITQVRKRPSDSDSLPRPTKIMRPSQPLHSAQTKLSISADQLEALVEKKVSEILAARVSQAAEPAAPAVAAVHPDINDAVQKRLEALERRIQEDERREDSRSDGLRHLLLARQAKEKGDDATALEMYELALPFFPGQAKLLGKIEKLRARLGMDVEETAKESRRKRRKVVALDEDEYHGAVDADADADESFVYRDPKPRSKKTAKHVKVAVPLTTTAYEPTSPRSQQLLDIVNSRDLAQIQRLHGFGAKKARDLVDFLRLMGEDDDGNIFTLAQLRTVPGMGGRTVERAYEGLVGAVVFQNVTAPASTFICGSQGAGKSNTLACLLENCLLRSKLGSLPRPLTGIVFHYDGFNSDLIGLPCEAAFLASDRQVSVRVLCAPTNIQTIKNTYARVPNVVIEPFRLRDEDLNTQRMLNLMAVGAGNVPLYMHVVTRILREMRISQQNSGQPFKYSQFKATMNKEDLQVAQSVPLQQRLDTLESFMASSAILSKKQKKAMKTTEANNWTPCPSQLIIVDLSCPCVTSDMACSLFNIALQLFLEGDKSVSRVVALDEAHKYMRDSSPESCIFTENLLGVIRQQRHLGTRVIISTQEPTISPKLLDLCSVTIVHRFTSPDWLRTLQKHLAGVSSLVPAENEGTEAKKNHGRPGVHPITVRGRDPAAELFSLIVNLCTGQALVFSPSSIIGSKDLDRGCTG
ncbi:hypothetical protein VDGE_02139 [Verticillium dahliae]|uniref:Kinesin motor domain-containing protein n=1 Tax=Verticillium dahliae TaxID=27337 RepID=A0A444RNW7_VERDA|nr:hypothetical protein VDGE_02139 [Verticillium dahliae]